MLLVVIWCNNELMLGVVEIGCLVIGVLLALELGDLG